LGVTSNGNEIMLKNSLPTGKYAYWLEIESNELAADEEGDRRVPSTTRNNHFHLSSENTEPPLR